MAALMAEYAFLGTARFEAMVVSKRHVEPHFDPSAIMAQPGGDLGLGTHLYTLERYEVFVLVNGHDLHVEVAPEMFKLIQPGATVDLFCNVARITSRLLPIRIEIPLPSTQAVGQSAH